MIRDEQIKAVADACDYAAFGLRATQIALDDPVNADMWWGVARALLDDADRRLEDARALRQEMAA
jgi:hypothetical protein